MNDKKIKEITDKAKTWCLVGSRSFERDVQQFTCKFINGENCKCQRDYLQALQNYKDENNSKNN